MFKWYKLRKIFNKFGLSFSLIKFVNSNSKKKNIPSNLVYFAEKILIIVETKGLVEFYELD